MGVPREGLARSDHVVIRQDSMMTNFWFNQVVSKQQITPPPPQNGYVVNAHTEMEEVACNATNIGKSVPVVPIVPVRLRSA